MAEKTFRTPLEVTPEQYFEICLFDPEYSTRLFGEVLKFPGVEVLENNKEGATWKRRVKVSPPVDGLPGPLKKLVGDSMSYVEEGTYDPAAKRYRYTVQPSVAADKSKTTGEAWFEQENGKTVLVTRFSIEVKVMLVGSTIEKKILDDLEDSLRRAAPFITEFVKSKTA